MNASPSVEKMLAIIRWKLKGRDLRMPELAELLRRSESSVKRYLRGTGVTLGALETLAKVVGLDLLSLAVVASCENEIPSAPKKSVKAKHVAKKNRRSVHVNTSHNRVS